MKDNTTLGEVKARCEEMTAKYGTDHCCEKCDYAEMGCCDPPEHWQLEAQPDMKAQPNWEVMFQQAEKYRQELCMKLEDMTGKADALRAENRRLRTIVSTVETMIGRKFEV